MNSSMATRIALCVLVQFGLFASSFAQTAQNLTTAHSNVNFTTPSTASGFTQNQGQFTDEKGKPVPFVFYKMAAPGMDIYLCDSGLTFVFTKITPQNTCENKDAKGPSVKKEWNRIDMHFDNATISPEQVHAEAPTTQGYSNYYLPHCAGGILNVKEYSELTVENLYQGIDLVLHADAASGLKYDFIVHPGADPSRILIHYNGASMVNAEHDQLKVKCALGEISEGNLFTYQDGGESTVTSAFVLSGNSVRYSIGNYDRAKDLVIDPPLVWATYYGGNADDFCFDITTDQQGNVFVTGTATASNFPCQDPGGGAYYQGSGIYYTHWISDAFVLKFNDQGVRQWATYYGGDGAEIGYGIKVDPSGNVYVVGTAEGLNMPVLDQGNGSYYQAASAGGSQLMTNLNLGDAFILKFNNAGVRIWATYFGGAGADGAMNLDIDANGNIFVTGITGSTNFPSVDPGNGAWYQAASGGNEDVFISEFNPAGTLVWSTYYGGSLDDEAYGIYVDANNDIYITGASASTNFPVLNPGGTAFFQGTLTAGVNTDVIILRFGNNGVREWATYYGGNKIDQGQNICVDINGNILVTGMTTSADMPTLDPGNGAYYQGTYGGAPMGDGGDIFIYKFGPQNDLIWATFYGGTQGENDPNNEYFMSHSSVTTDASGSVYVSGSTTASGFPVYDPGGDYYYLGTYQGGLTDGGDVVIMKFSATCAREWSTFYGGTDDDFSQACTVDPTNNCFYVVGFTLSGSGWGGPSTNLFTVDPGGGAYVQNTNASFKKNGYILKFCDSCVAPSVEIADAVVCGGSAVLLSAQNPGSNVLWSTGDTAQVISVSAPGVYWVQVTDDGCTATDYFQVTDAGANTGDDLVIPNVFTPDGDGVNEAFGMSGSYGNLYELWIYDRWGNLMFYSNEQAHMWDGVFNKDLASAGVYYYIFDYNLPCRPEAEVYKTTGFLHLIRN